MPKELDTRGRSCPEPVIMTKKQLNTLKQDEKLIVLVGEEVAKENVSRFARNSGFNVEVNTMEDEYKLLITHN